MGCWGDLEEFRYKKTKLNKIFCDTRKLCGFGVCSPNNAFRWVICMCRVSVQTGCNKWPFP